FSIRAVLLLTESPPDLKGRVYSVNNLLVSSSDDLSEWESGLSAHFLGLHGAVAFGSAATMLASAAFLQWTRPVAPAEGETSAKFSLLPSLEFISRPRFFV